MRSRIRVALAVGTALALAGVGIASAEKPTIVQAENPLPVINGGFSPKALPKKGKPAALTFGLSARVATADDSAPPALHEVSLELDRHITADAKGMPACSRVEVEGPLPEESCRAALLGKGTIDVLVRAPGQAQFATKGKLLAFNAGFKHGTPTIFLHAYLAAPASEVVLTTVRVTKINRGRFGTKWLFLFPRIAGDYGSITRLNLKIGRLFSYMGKKKSYLLARCPDSHLDARATSVFADGSAQADSFVRSCTPKP